MTTTWDATAFDAFERRNWTGRSEAYRSGFARMTARTVAPLLDAAGVGPGTRVLDVGTGPGVVAAVALARGAAVTAVDASPEMAAHAAKACPEADVRVAVLPELPFPDCSFDAVVGNFVINHLGDPAAGLVELRRVLRPGGLLALTCWERVAMRATAVFGEAVAASGIPYPPDLPSSGPFLADAEPEGRAEAFAALLADAGLAGASAERIAWLHRVDPDAWWHAVVAGTPLTGALIARQGPATAAAVKAHYDRLVAPYAEPLAEPGPNGTGAGPDGAGDGTGSGPVALPAVAILATGHRPAVLG
ncbi:class I SAM-dependent methyltransferase [Streptacidiphilus cavernicola]|uniref:Class I SAM-dependent methyltransferase n=1 Tax=Streptacidiphilus cavernicola TaxID=3342716 RepID=A0ABV6W1T3_9ACTN